MRVVRSMLASVPRLDNRQVPKSHTCQYLWDQCLSLAKLLLLSLHYKHRLNIWLSKQWSQEQSLHVPGTEQPTLCQVGSVRFTLYVSTSLACGKWNGAMNRRTHSLFTPSRYRLSAMIRATKFLPVPDQPWKESVSGLLDSGLLRKPWMAFRTTDWAKCCPWSFLWRSLDRPACAHRRECKLRDYSHRK